MKTLVRGVIIRIFEFQAKRLIHRQELRVIAVAGSVGKTSTKTAIARVVEQKYPGKVLLHSGNYNTELSVPVSLFDLVLPGSLLNPVAWFRLILKSNRIIKHGYQYEVAIIELGTDRPGDMARFMRYLKPDYGVVTAIVPEHMEAFKTLDAVAEEEFLLALHARKPVLNLEDERIRSMADQVPEASTYGSKGIVRFEKTRPSQQGYSVVINLGSEKLEAQTNLVGEHSLLAILAAAAIGIDMGLTSSQIKQGIEAFKPVNGRMHILRGKRDATILDDSYNASPDAVRAALKALKAMEGKRKIAILGSMNELGDMAESAHKDVGVQCSSLDLLITIGSQANKWLAPAARAAGLAEAQVKSFGSPYEAGVFAAAQLKSGDTVLVKGSQNGVFSEEAIKSLLANPADETHLVRQSPQWLAKKQAQFK